FHLAVDLCGADPHAAGVEHRVGAAVDHHAAVRGDLAPVTVAPDAGKFLEVGGAVLRAVRVVPEADRHRGEGPRAHELALLAAHGFALLVENIDGHAEALGLDLAAPHPAHGI